MDKKTVKDVDVIGKRVLVRVDFNVPFNEQTGEITDDSRIRASLSTIEYLMDHNAKVILCSHLGRPMGKIDSRYSLETVAKRLGKILREKIKFAHDCIGPEVELSVSDLENGEVLMLENLRFYPDEEDNNPDFARQVAQLGDIFVNDAFGTSHRKHASIIGVTNYLPSVAGLLLEKEINSLGHILENPKRPFGVLLGGAKITDKVGLLDNIMDKVDYIIVGGGMAATFLKAQGHEVGKSLIDGSLETAAMLIDKVAKNGVRLFLPDDVLVAENTGFKTPVENAPVSKISPDKAIVDIGPLTITKFTEILERCRTVFWNGPMGIYEIPEFSEGTRTIARVMSNLLATTIVGGGSTAEIMTEMKLAEKMTFVSTGGGASLEFLSGDPLPGVAVLINKEPEMETATSIASLKKANKVTARHFKKISPSLSIENNNKIIMLVIDGLGGLPEPVTGKTELETALTPNLDKLATQGVCGFSLPVDHGITPGSAPGHLSLFGYDPAENLIGRGVLEALGVDIDIKPGDVVARGNFCTIDNNGYITDRRAGRIATEEAFKLCHLLNGKSFDGIEVIVKPVKEHRLVVIFRGEGLDACINDTDPQQAGIKPITAEANDDRAIFTAGIVNKFSGWVKETLNGHIPANMVVLRGFSALPALPTMQELYKLNPVAIAGYPMYRGLAKLCGMHILQTGPKIEDEIKTLADNYAAYDFFFVHIKGADSAGEDGDFDRKVAVIEEVDRIIPRLLKLNPSVLIVAGDHSTPAVLKAHSWHPVPLILYARYCRRDKVDSFSESSCIGGGLGTIPATSILPLAMANSFKFNKYGA